MAELRVEHALKGEGEQVEHALGGEGEQVEHALKGEGEPVEHALKGEGEQVEHACIASRTGGRHEDHEQLCHCEGLSCVSHLFEPCIKTNDGAKHVRVQASFGKG